jgi:uncharacterized protein (DUF983 family)
VSFAERGVAARPARSGWRAALRGALCRCPNCGRGWLFSSYLRVVDRCPACAEDLSHHRADDAPPYFTILIVGHAIIGLVLWVEIVWSPPIWVHAALWLPLTLGLALALLPPVKGVVVGLQWAFFMHGFGGEEDERPDGGLPP